jgi:hypothetical protein
MTRPFAVDITANDKTNAGVRSAERRFKGLEKSSAGLARSTDKWGRGTGIPLVIKGLNGMAGAGARAAGGLASATIGTSGLATGAAAASWALGGLVGAAVLATAAGARFGVEWAKGQTAIGRTARGIGMAASELQKFQLAGRYAGVEADSMSAALQGVGEAFHDSAFGRNPEAQAMLVQLGIRLKRTKDGAVDVKQAMLDIAKAMEGRNPHTQRKIAQVLGVEGALPFLNRGRAQVQKDLNAAMASGAIVSDDYRKKAEELTREVEKMTQRLEGLRNVLAQKFIMPWLTDLARVLGSDGGILDVMTRAIAGDPKATAEVRRRFFGFAQGGGGGPGASGGGGGVAGFGRRIGGDFGAFAERVEQKESRGRQFDSRGRPLTSSAGAIGVMQLMPATAQATARKHGIAWDPDKLRTDADYNRRLGRLHLWDLRQKYGGSEVLAAAAYNAGEGRLDGMWLRDRQGNRARGADGKPIWRDGWLKRFGDPRKGEITETEFARRIPIPETQDYVTATAGLGGIGKDAKTTVDINLRGAPRGTTVDTRADRNVRPAVKVEQAMHDD